MSFKSVINAASKNADYDLVIFNVKIANVYTKELLDGNICIKNGIISHVDYGNYSELPASSGYFDGKGKIAAPGFIDTHMHIESSMMNPVNFANVALPHGTTTAVCDPHEIANVAGIKGIEYMIENSKSTPMDLKYVAPSCVPSAVGVETAGASFGGREIKKILEMDGVIGIAELMDYPGVVSGDSRMMEIIEEAHKKNVFIQGHAPLLSCSHLSAYISSGARSDHEVRTFEEAMEKLRLGVVLECRESSGAKNIPELAKAVIKCGFPSNATLCTDDRDAGDLLVEGHLDQVARSAVLNGIPPIETLKMITLNAASWLRLYDRGAISPGLRADIVLIDDFEKFNVDEVFVLGNLVARGGKVLSPAVSPDLEFEKTNSVRLNKLDKSSFAFDLPDGNYRMKIMSIDPDITYLTTLETIDVDVLNGYVDISDTDLVYLAVFERHNIDKTSSLCLLRNSGISHGAVASTISHDCHNLVVIGKDIDDMVLCANTLIECGGGVAVSADKRILSVIELPIGGIMASKSAEELIPEINHTKQVIKSIGFRGAPIMQIATLSLAVLPHVRLTNLGLVDVSKQKVIPLV